MLRHLVWMFFLVTLTIHKAEALVFIEPQVGYGTGSMSFEYNDIFDPSMSFSDDFDLKGIGYGAKAGFELGNWQLGAEYMEHKLKVSGGSGTFQIDDDNLDTKEYTALIGYRFSFFRLYGGYIFNVDFGDSSDLDAGAGFKAGLSFYALRNMALNLEYRNVENNEVATVIKFSQVAFLLSFPFSI